MYNSLFLIELHTANTHCLHVNIHTAYHILLKKTSINQKRGEKWRTENGFKFWSIGEKTTTNRCVHTARANHHLKTAKAEVAQVF